MRLENALAKDMTAAAQALRMGFRAHGLAILPCQETALCAPFLDGVAIPALFDLAFLDIAEIARRFFDWLLRDDDEDDDDAPGEDDFWTFIQQAWSDHPFTAPFAKGWAYLLSWSVFGPDNIVNGFDEFTKALQHYRAKYRRRCIHRIHILGHGGEIWSGATGAVIGSSILIGVSDELRSTDFDDAGNLVPGAQKTKDFLDALKAALCPGGRIVFSACNQGVGSLLEDISKYIDNGTTVEGHSGLGIPWLPGDMSFVDGQRQ